MKQHEIHGVSKHAFYSGYSFENSIHFALIHAVQYVLLQRAVQRT